MFRGYDEDYEHADILNHIKMIDVVENTLNYLIDEAGTKEKFFAECVPENFIHTRTILLGSLQDGLTIGGKSHPSDKIEKGCGLASAYSMIPFEAIQYRFFGKPDISFEDLINVIVPKYMVGG